MDGETPVTTLRARPDWVYLLQDLYEFYRAIPAGGSAKIRGHQRAVRERISKALAKDVPLRERVPTKKPVLAHLTRAFARARLERHAPFMATLEAVQGELEWLYGYEKVPRGLEHKFAFAELAGPNGPVVIDDLILGLVLFAPGTTYPAHAHDGITESYICLTGAVSENDAGVYAPGSLIFNPPGHLHRITTADQQPSLLAYAWVGAPEALAGQKMTFSRKKAEGQGDGKPRA
jgi:dimethylpropiothetin dethiomethylase